MKVELISYPDGLVDVIYTACRTCYSKLSPIEIFKSTNEKSMEDKLKLVQKVFDSGHLSCSEHNTFTFAIAGISRSCLAQISRHRLASFSVQSQRYVEIKENLEDLIILNTCGTPFDKMQLLSKYFVFRDENELLSNNYLEALITYLKLIKEGYPAEDARNVLPNATKTNMVLSCNLRELMHICKLRLCLKAQDEVRTMVQYIKNEVCNREPWLRRYLITNCNNCTDFRDCERKRGNK